MTREEAISLLHDMKDTYDEIHENTNGDIGYEQMTALDMAIEALSAEAKPTVIRSKTLLPTKDFKEWAKRVRETNPNVIVIPCDAEVVSAEAVQGEWIKKQVFNPELDKYIPYIECSVCGYAPYYGGSESKFNYCPNCGARMKGGDSE